MKVVRIFEFWVGRRDSKSIVAIADSRECEFFGVALDLNVEANPKRGRWRLRTDAHYFAEEIFYP